MLKEFKKFIMRGNVLDLAVGVIIGGAFGKIITSLVNDIIMPPIGLILGKVDFSNLFITMSGEKFDMLVHAQEAGSITLNIGLFINSLVDFLIISLAIFLLVKQLNKLEKKEEKTVEIVKKTCPFCLTEISKEATRCSACTSKV
jgi:large conductance mechanosensitive channel